MQEASQEATDPLGPIVLISVMRHFSFIISLLAMSKQTV